MLQQTNRVIHMHIYIFFFDIIRNGIFICIRNLHVDYCSGHHSEVSSFLASFNHGIKVSRWHAMSISDYAKHLIPFVHLTVNARELSTSK